MYKNSYLTAMDSRIYSRREQRFRVNLEGRIAIVLPRLAGLVMKNCRIVDISTEGAGLMMLEMIGLPQHFYLTVNGFFDRLGCAEISRVGNRVSIRFLKPLDERWLNATLGENRRMI